jgi:2-polyprenyl-6-methoxyphenol hydroxylase-like FAD-dependent oxidoreductase
LPLCGFAGECQPVVVGKQLCIVGGGPAGMVAGLLFARAGVATIVLEKHRDFLRDFRGDTVHPSTLRIFHELGLLGRLLDRPHDRVPDVDAVVGGRSYTVADLSAFDPRWNFIAMMPQWEFLDFVAEAARAYPHFKLVMEAEATGLIEEGGRVRGVRYREAGVEREIRADLVIASDGRRSVLREASALEVRTLGAPMDVFWFRIPKARGAKNETTGIFTPGHVIVLIDRGDYWQCAYLFRKGEVEAVRSRGLDAFRAEVAAAAPQLAGEIAAIGDWEDVKLLSVGLDRLETWHKPGLLVIGDAAHTMSPIGGVGINLAVQDAVAAANIVAAPLARGENVDPLLAKVQARRMLPVRVVQFFQKLVQDRIVGRVLAGTTGGKAPLPLRLLGRFPFLRRIPAAFIGFGIRPEHVRSPSTGQP